MRISTSSSTVQAFDRPVLTSNNLASWLVSSLTGFKPGTEFVWFFRNKFFFFPSFFVRAFRPVLLPYGFFPAAYFIWAVCAASWRPPRGIWFRFVFGENRPRLSHPTAQRLCGTPNNVRIRGMRYVCGHQDIASSESIGVYLDKPSSLVGGNPHHQKLNPPPSPVPRPLRHRV